MAKKMKPELLALSTGIILSIYGAGYLHTQAAASASAPAQHISAPASIPTIGSGSGANGAATQTPASTLRDGTYNGTGSNYLGDVSVAVTVASGKISQVQITACDMHYPEYWIDGMPAEVVAAQSTNINFVSGATASSQAFSDAVTQALSQAA
ncbi:MAG TPA: FMN-binding protein [Chloroflexota bacterium]|nr:FMN-binding protein [Chloroflexota bacterium]